MLHASLLHEQAMTKESQPLQFPDECSEKLRVATGLQCSLQSKEACLPPIEPARWGSVILPSWGSTSMEREQNIDALHQVKVTKVTFLQVICTSITHSTTAETTCAEEPRTANNEADEFSRALKVAAFQTKNRNCGEAAAAEPPAP